jgi:hypothetical protein
VCEPKIIEEGDGIISRNRAHSAKEIKKQADLES